MRYDIRPFLNFKLTLTFAGVDSDKYEGGEEVSAADKGDSEEATEEHCDAGQESTQPSAEQEAGAAN